VTGKRRYSPGPRVTVVGAGAFGGWTALELVRRGARVTLVDAWGPGNVRSSSGGETRVIRAAYGTRALYTKMATRALQLWRDHDRRFHRAFFRQTGALWMFGGDDAFGRSSLAAFRAENLSMERLTLAAARRAYPQVAFGDVASVFFEPEAGYLLARRACEHVVERVVAEGGGYAERAVMAPVDVRGARLERVTAASGAALSADAFVFACGPWLATLFPDVVGKTVRSTRQDVFYFGAPAGDARFGDEALPVWGDVSDRTIYGVPGNVNRGFKIADDTAGPPFDPTSGHRAVNPAGLKSVRAFLARRFPALANAPLVGSEVCQYEATPDSDYLIDRHPGASNVWLVGGGSGHGFKMGPAIGELVASLVLGESEPDPYFSLARFARQSARRSIEKWR
jgi:glycine/D-amino acid oxidase-like deaminating enzyme